MASSSYPFLIVTLCVVSVTASCVSAGSVHEGLSSSFYDQSCSKVQNIVRLEMTRVFYEDPRMLASVLRLHHHDCFVNGCDASILLDDTDSFVGEKNAAPNKNSARGFEVIDDIKAKVEAECPGTVSCADILALAAQVAVDLLGGPSWIVPLGRKDSITANQSAANDQIPPPSSNLATLISKFEAKGLSAREMAALSGAHTIGQAQCKSFRDRIYNETNIDTNFGTSRRSSCPSSGGDTNMASLETLTPDGFDNNYYRDLMSHRGLLHSDQELFNGGSLDDLVRHYSENRAAFSRDFAAAMVKMSKISPLTGSDGEIRKNCRVVN